MGAYDYSSLMHYGAYSFSKNNLPTIVPLTGSLNDIGQRQGLSSGDIAGLNAIYPPPPAPPFNPASIVPVYLLLLE